MGLDLAGFAQLRPRLYHLTARSNVEQILRTRELLSASTWLGRAGRSARERRAEHVRLRTAQGEVVLRDQMPLHPGNMAIDDGLGFADVVEMLNERVFFWPGSEAGPIESGRRHFQRYGEEDCRVLVIPTESMFRANPGTRAEFCRFNSGSPRWTGGRASPRGKRTFRRAFEFDGTASDVVEVTWVGRVALPPDSRVVDHGRWVSEG